MDQCFTIKNNLLCGEESSKNSYCHELGQLFFNTFSDNPNHVGQIDAVTEKETTFSEMKENTVRCALWMKQENIGKNDVVVICSPNHADDYIPCIATFYIGAIYNAWEPDISLHTARHFMKLIKPKVIFVYESDVEIINEAATLENVEVKIIVFGKYPKMQSLRETLILQTDTEIQNFQCLSLENAKDIAMILFSSGTTGLMKGIAHSYEVLLRLTGTRIISFKEGRRLWYASLNWISGTICTLQNIVFSQTRIFHAKFEPEETCKIIQKFQINWLFLSPTMLTYLIKSNVLNKFELKSLKTFLSGGTKISRALISNVKENLPYSKFLQVYGMTEVGGAVCMQNEHCKKIESVGFVMPNTQLKIIDLDNGKVLGFNQPGELCIKSPTIMLGYYKNLTATKETIDQEGWLHTGDKGYYDENGEIFIIDRLKEMIIYRGYCVTPSDIEELLISHVDVIEAAVVPVLHEVDTERAMAFVKKFPYSKVSEEELIKLSSELGKERTLWGGVKFLDEIPHTSSGKINRKKLKEMARIYAE